MQKNKKQSLLEEHRNISTDESNDNELSGRCVDEADGNCVGLEIEEFVEENDVTFGNRRR